MWYVYPDIFPFSTQMFAYIERLGFPRRRARMFIQWNTLCPAELSLVA